MIRVGDTLPGLYPSTYTDKDIDDDRLLRQQVKRHPTRRSPVRNRVEWIHPEGRFVVVRFLYDHGSFCESFPLQWEGGERHGTKERI